MKQALKDFLSPNRPPRTPFELAHSVLESKRLNKPIPEAALEWFKAGLWVYSIYGVPLEDALRISAPYQGSNMNAGFCYRQWLKGHFITSAWHEYNAPPFDSPEFETFRQIVKQMSTLVKAGASPDDAWPVVNSQGKFPEPIRDAFRYNASVPTSKPRLKELITSHREATVIPTLSDMLAGIDEQKVRNG